jgi:hypothetical protein
LQSGKSCDKSQHSERGEKLMMKSLFVVAIVGVAVLTTQAQLMSLERPRVVIYDDVATQVRAALTGEVTTTPGPADELWITITDLTRATRFVIKPQGVCRDELCFPLPKSRRAEFTAKKGSTTWFNLTEFARLIKQPFVTDQKNGVWCFGARAAEQSSYLTSLEAPNFTLPDLSGKLHSLADFRGKKVLLVTWASW